MIHVPGAGFCDDQLPVLSTIGRGPRGPQGEKGDQGDKGDTSSFEPLTDAQIDTVTNDGTLTSTNGLDGSGLTYLWGKIKAKFAATMHNHAASDITSGELAIARGGTGASSASDARTNLGTSASSSIATIESVIATSDHAIGDYFMLDSVLMRATMVIHTGEQITASNATPATVQGQIDTLRDSMAWKSHTATKSNKIQDFTANVYSVGKIVVVSYFFVPNVNLVRNDTIATLDLPTAFASNFFNGSTNLKDGTKNICADTSFTSGGGYLGLLVGVMI